MSRKEEEKKILWLMSYIFAITTSDSTSDPIEFGPRARSPISAPHIQHSSSTHSGAARLHAIQTQSQANTMTKYQRN